MKIPNKPTLMQMNQLINQTVESPKHFADLLTNAKFNQADRLKIGRKEYHYAIEGSFSAGQLSIVETVLESHRKNRYTDVDTLLGDFHILYAKVWEDQRKLHPTKMPTRSLEEIIEIEMEKNNQIVQ